MSVQLLVCRLKLSCVDAAREPFQNAVMRKDAQGRCVASDLGAALSDYPDLPTQVMMGLLLQLHGLHVSPGMTSSRWISYPHLAIM